jgi:hypothetical protein
MGLQSFILLSDYDRQTAEEHIFFAGMTESVIPA